MCKKQDTLLGRPIVLVKDMPDFGEITLGDFSAYIHKLTIIKCCDSPDVVWNHDSMRYICPNCGKKQELRIRN